MQKIISLNNQNLIDDCKLKDKKYRSILKKYLVEGIKMVQDAVLCGMSVDKIYVLDTYLSKYGDFLTSQENCCVKIVVLDGKCFEKISDTINSQGIVAVLNIPNTYDFSPSSNVLLLDNLQDPGNVGTLIRTAAALGFTSIFTLNCVDPYSPKAVRSSMSGIYKVDIFEVDIDVAKTLLDKYQIIVGDLDGVSIDDFVFDKEKYCLCLGNEGNGISQEVRNLANVIIKIPMLNAVESLNVGVCGAIMMYCIKYNR